MPRRPLPALLAVAALACGGGDDVGSSPDPVDAGYGTDGGGGDAAPSTCTYTEADEAGNAGAAEVTGAVAGAAILCGRVDPDQAGGDHLDRDRFAFVVAAEADLLVRASAPQASRVEDLRVVLRGETDLAVGRVLVDHGAVALHLSPGAYELEVVARGPTARTEAFGYRVQLGVDAPALRCPTAAGDPDHTEVDESRRLHRGNDVVEVRRSGSPLRALTGASDAPDPSELVLSAGDVAAIDGSSASVTSAGDDYRDRDAFLIATGARTSVLELRASWAAPLADLDVLLLPAGEIDEVAAAMTAGAPDEALITAVAPSSTYWLWVGAAKGSTGLPAAYRVTLCAREYRLEF